ncbi:zinc ribbon domain-containing protein [Nannocystis sp.]|uniref:zinc ribbon domain-containing protein n=1 Tax=Nannocystis sp. TaxID=1962667 RepID=UPI0025F60D4D|nr:zinc ribbon domain-containing protein [Nannocystis sp.]MBK7828421.1 zinc ribbon domain-containing protein [Nannocystis sp.]
MAFCPKCGTKTSPEHQFCAACGVSLTDATPAERTDSLFRGSSSPRKTAASGVSVWRIAFGVVVGVGILWVFLPGIFDSRSPSIFGSEHRRSPLVDMAGPRTIIDDSINIKEDQYQHYTFEIKVPSTVSLTVTRVKGPAFEVYVVEKSDFDEWKNAANSLFGGQFHHFPDLSGTVNAKNPSHDRKGTLKAGTYVVIIDNTDFGSVSPPANFADDVVTARVKATLE